MIEISIDRKKIKEEAEIKSAKADMKQHANKLIQGFEAADESHVKRALWELVQNARDLSSECDISIEFKEEGLSFTHNGKPFDSDTLLSLIKQVSSKSGNKFEQSVPEEEMQEIGQYGTGFITTHAFGKKFKINGSLHVEADLYIPLEDFEIDRIAANSDILVDKLVDQQRAVFKLLEEGQPTREKRHTTLTYVFSDLLEQESAKAAVEKYLYHYVPTIMCLNSRINSFTITNHLNQTTRSFKKGLQVLVENIWVYPIINELNEVTNIYSIKSSDEEMEVILPISSLTQTLAPSADTARLFLYFPLIGTEHWGINYIIHSGKFSPTEKRDGLHLQSTNKQTQEKEASNQTLLSKASDLIFDFVQKHSQSLTDPIHLAPIAFSTYSENKNVNEYQEKLKKQWVSKFKDFPLTDTLDGRKTPQASRFLDLTLFSYPAYKDAIYHIVSKFWKNIPVSAIAKEWTEIVMAWEYDQISFITLQDIAAEIEATQKLDGFDPSILQQFYRFINDSGNSQIFDEYKLLPNIKNHFEQRKNLHTANTIHETFIAAADILVPEVPKSFIKSDFTLNSDYADYTRRQLSKDWNARIGELANEITLSSLLANEIRDALIVLCSTFPSLENKGVRGDLIKIIGDFYNVTVENSQIPHIEDDKMEYFIPLKALVRHFFTDMLRRSKEDPLWVSNNLNLIEETLELVTDNREFDDLVKSMPIFPNQNEQFEYQEKLFIEEGIPNELKDLYDKVLNKNVRNILVLDTIKAYLPHANQKPGLDLSNEITLFLESQNSLETINEHPSKIIIMGIINQITSDPKVWSRLFPQINEKRATIMMARITQEELKEDMFSILGLTDNAKISLLGELARSENMLQIIARGRQSLEDEKHQEADFQFKHSIGIHLEELLHQKLNNEFISRQIKVISSSQQGGQDLIIYKGDDIAYYIEVKSRWTTESSVTMSTLQMRTSALHAEKYALCYINMAIYQPTDGDRYYPENIEAIEESIRFLTKIGDEVKPLISTAMAVEKDPEKVKMEGDYRARVPLSMAMSTGKKLESFIDFLCAELSK